MNFSSLLNLLPVPTVSPRLPAEVVLVGALAVSLIYAGHLKSDLKKAREDHAQYVAQVKAVADQQKAVVAQKEAEGRELSTRISAQGESDEEATRRFAAAVPAGRLCSAAPVRPRPVPAAPSAAASAAQADPRVAEGADPAGGEGALPGLQADCAAVAVRAAAWDAFYSGVLESLNPHPGAE